MVDGEMEIKIGGNPYNVKAGEILVMPAGIPHGLKATIKSKAAFNYDKIVCEKLLMLLY